MKSEIKLTEAKHHDIKSLYNQIQELAAMSESSKLWKNIVQNYDEDIQVNKINSCTIIILLLCTYMQ